MKNNKGFTLVEILAVVAILGILMGLAIMAYTKYIDYSRKKSQDIFEKSVISATENYIFDHPDKDEVDIDTLIDEEYLEKPTDEVLKKAKGRIKVKENDNGNGLSTYDYKINMCIGENYYTYNSATKTKETDKRCKADPYSNLEEVLDEIPKIKVLNVYPKHSSGVVGNQLQGWMNSYGKGKIEVTPVYILDFNSNPGSYLKKQNGKWNYDEIVFGFVDCNGNQDLSANAASLVDDYLNSGGAAIFGHDTITTNGCGNHSNFNSLKGHVNLETRSGIKHQSSTKVKIVRKGVFTEYPYKIGDVNTILTIPSSHVYGQVANGDIWITFENINDNDDANKIYLSTYGRNAFIQTGHSNGTATADEQKIIANIIFYMDAQQYVNDD